MKRRWAFCVVLLLVLGLIGCAKKDKPKEIVTETNSGGNPAATSTPALSKEPANEKENHDGQTRSKLTGLWVSDKTAQKRPVALMINNISFASPQTGIGKAAILYEAVVEGGITRLMAIFEKVSGDKLGSMRSARHYFVSFADEYDAIFAHYGQTKYATAKIKELGIDNLSGLESIGSTVYYRDNAIKAPHNAFASSDGIKKGIEIKGYRTKLREDLDNHFTFYEKDSKLSEGEPAKKKVTLAYSGYTSPYFTYNVKDKLYYRYQFGEKHIDKETGKQLTFKNIILQYVSYWTIDQKNGYQSMDIEDSKGNGLYITNGKAVKITWDKNESKKEMHYYDEQGNLLTINPGKTYIGLYPESRLKELKVE